MTPSVPNTPIMFIAEAYGRTIGIEYGTDDEIDLPFLPFAWTTASRDTPVDRRYRVTGIEDDRWSVAIDDGEPQRINSRSLVLDHVEGDLHHWLATYTRGYLFVHAGCVAWNERAIVIPGRSYAGKTTLTRALLELGATYYSDDYAVIDPTGAIHPFPRRLQFRPPDAGRQVRIDPAHSNWPIGQHPIRAVLIAELKFDSEEGWAVTTQTQGAGALSLLDNTVAARERPEDALRIMSSAVDGAIAIIGTRDDASTSARRLIAMVEDLGS